MIRFATTSKPRMRNAEARTPHANPTELWNSWFSMIGKMMPPTDPPEAPRERTGMSGGTKKRWVPHTGEDDADRKRAPCLPVMGLDSDGREVDEAAANSHAQTLGQKYLVVFVDVGERQHEEAGRGERVRGAPTQKRKEVETDEKT